MMKKKLPPKKLGPKGRPAPKEQDDEEEPGDEAEGEGEGEDGPAGAPMDEGDDSDGEPGEGDEEQSEEEHEVAEDKLLAIMHEVLGKLDALQHGGMHGMQHAPGMAPPGGPQMPQMQPGGPVHPGSVDPMQALVRRAMG